LNEIQFVVIVIDSSVRRKKKKKKKKWKKRWKRVEEMKMKLESTEENTAMIRPYH
jgi:hypothetical protein